MKGEHDFDPVRRSILKSLLCFPPAIAAERVFGPLAPDVKIDIRDIIQAFPSPNPDLALVNSSFVPREGTVDFFLPGDQEVIITAINHNDLEIGGYGQGVREAIKRGQKVIITIANPSSFSYWENYVRKIALSYQPTGFVVGNETNVPPTYINPNLYSQLFMVAKTIINEVCPKTKVYPAAEAYFGNGEYIKQFLEICQANRVNLDGLPFHFYGYPNELPERIALLRRLGKETGYVNLPLLATEMSRPENENFTEEELADFLLILQCHASRYLGKELELAAWYCAFDFGTSRGHSLITDDLFHQLHPRKAFYAYLLSSRLLFRNIVFQKEGPLTKVRTESKEGLSSSIVWNNGQEDIRIRTPKGHFAFDSGGNQLSRFPFLPQPEKVPKPVILIPQIAFGIPNLKKPFPV